MPNLTINSRGAEVKELQDSLVKIGFIIPQHELDEQVFGIGTLNGLQSLQRKYKLSVTLIVDEAAQAMLKSAVASTTSRV